MNSLLVLFPICGRTYLSLPLEQRRWQKLYRSCQGNGYVCRHHSWRSMSSHAWGARLAWGHPEPHGDWHSSCCMSMSKTKNESAREILSKNDSFFRTNCPRSTKRTGHWAWLVALFLEVIALAIILLFVGLATLWVLVVTLKTTVASIVLMTIVRYAIIAIALVALVIVPIFVATMLLVVWFAAMCRRKMSHFLFFWLLLILGNLLENASCLASCLTLLKESNKLEQVSRHRLVQVRKLELMRLGLCKEDLFTFPLRRGYFHHSTEVATLEIAEKL